MRIVIFGYHRSFIVSLRTCIVRCKICDRCNSTVIRIRIRNITIMETKETIRQREKGLYSNVKNQLSNNIEKKEKKQEPQKKNFKYYLNRFRYYHYYCSEKINSFIAIVCMWIIKIQFYLMGFGINGLPSIHEIEKNHFKNDSN
ncbi:uncharacterized protein LOC105833793 [Monomorium pharaonis]|uniref:uncharacterized protein LOC105833793 n=1 Tax=Monomorium pharaonis TaxID=307658 RepID=UPI0017476D3A|nr:uncharacterized protein LOC105833793 [Monomorium pharaonis]